MASSVIASKRISSSAVTNPPFEPGLRVGEDVDLFWRMEEAGWTVRYVPDVLNRDVVDELLTVEDDRAIATARRLAADAQG